MPAAEELSDVCQAPGVWIDPELDLFVIFLSSRLHPDGEGSVNDLVGRIGAVAAAALAP